MPQTEYHHQAHWPATRSITLIQGIILGLLLDIITGTDTGLADQDPSHTLADIEVTATTVCTKVTPDLITDTFTEVHYIINTQVLIVIDMTHHTEGHHHTEVPPLIFRDHSRPRPHTLYKSNRIASSKPSTSSTKTTFKHQDKKYKRVTNDDPQSEYYSSDYAASDSNDDLN